MITDYGLSHFHEGTLASSIRDMSKMGWCPSCAGKYDCVQRDNLIGYLNTASY